MSSTLPELSTESLNDTRKRHTFNNTIAYVPHNTTADETANNKNNKYSSNKTNDKEKQGTTILHSKRALGWHSAIGANVDSPLPSTTVNKNYTTTITGEDKTYNKEHMSEENKMNRICCSNDNYESNKTNFVNQYNNSIDNNTKKEEKHNREYQSSNNKNAVKLLEEDTLLSEFELPVITNIASPTVTSERSSAASSWSTSKAATGITTTTTTKVNKHHSRDAEAFRQNMTDFLNVMYQGSISPTYLQSMKPNINSKNSFNKTASFSGGKSHTSHITTTTNVPVSDKWSTSNALVTFTSNDATRPKQTANVTSPSSPFLLATQSATNEKKLAADTIVHSLNKEAKANADTTYNTNNEITTKTASESATQSSLPPFSPKTRYEDNIDALVNHLVRVLAHSNNISNSNSNNNINNNNNNKLRNWSGSNKRSSQSSSQSELSPLQFHKTVQWSVKGNKEEQKEYSHQEQEEEERNDRQSSTSTKAETEKAHVHKYKNREWLNAQHLNSPSNVLNSASINNNNNNNNYNINKNKGRSSNSDKITNTDVTANANALHKNKILSRSQLTLSQSTSPSSPSSHKATSPTARQWNVNTDVSQFVGQAMDNMFGNVSLYGASIINNHSSRSVLSTLWTDPNFAHLISFETKSHLNTADSNAFYDGNEDSEEESMTVVPIHVGTQALFQPISSQAQLSVSKSLEMPLYLPQVTNHHNTFTSSSTSINSISSINNNNNISLNSLNSKEALHNKSSTIPAMTTPTEGKSEKRTITSAEERALSAVKELKLLNAQSKTAAAATTLVPDLSTCANNKSPEHESKNEEQTITICQNEAHASKTKRNDIQTNTNTHSQCKKSLQSMSLNSALLLHKTNNTNTNVNYAACRNNKENKNSKELLVERQDSWAIIDAQMKQSKNNNGGDGNKNKNYSDDLLSLESMQEHQVANKEGKNKNNVVAKEKQQQEEQEQKYKNSQEAILDAKHNNRKVANNTSKTTTTMSTRVKEQQDAQGAKLSISKNNNSGSKGTRRMSNRLENSTDLTKLIDDEALSRNVLVAVERQLRNYIQLITSEKVE